MEAALTAVAYNSMLGDLFDMEPETARALLRFENPLEVIRDQLQERVNEILSPYVKEQMDHIADGGELHVPHGKEYALDAEYAQGHSMQMTM